ncbi:hypothetical protein SAMN04489712_106328 [Thermomonospora echinospora]|uniref:Lipoprotein n=1 Tax=Thermomonospora echinospora TaxID=1992 RepID=A0A1H6B804_9ACTN|nr:hypothetical protein [Thermomonospora echinospora]SEG56664.1 hypothetical protein SAMN04489712_106328 [Thermomonospora echinospora]
MRYGVKARGAVRVLAGGAVLTFVTAGCGMLGGNKSEVCADSRKAVEQYVSRLRTVAANEPAQWKQATEQLAARFDVLAGTAEDQALRKALKDQAAGLRTAATALGTGDAAALNKTLTDTPARLGDACA